MLQVYYLKFQFFQSKVATAMTSHLTTSHFPIAPMTFGAGSIYVGIIANCGSGLNTLNQPGKQVGSRNFNLAIATLRPNQAEQIDLEKLYESGRYRSELIPT